MYAGLVYLYFLIITYLERIGVGFYVARIVVTLLCLVCMVLAMVLLFRMVVNLIREYLRRLEFAQDSVSPMEWVQRIKQATPEHQALLLRSVDQQKLGVTIEEYLGILRSLDLSIIMEPALSVYWELRDNLEQVVKQERRG